jgi:hypothetical protein
MSKQIREPKNKRRRRSKTRLYKPLKKKKLNILENEMLSWGFLCERDKLTGENCVLRSLT